MLLPSLVLPAAAILIAFGYSQLPWSMLLLARQPSQVYDSMSELAITKAADYISSHCYRQQQQHLIHSCSSSSNSDLCKFTFTSTLAHFHTFTHTHTQTHTHTHTHTHRHTHTNTHTHTHTHAHTHTLTHTHSHTHTYTHTHACTHAHTHAHTHARPQLQQLLRALLAVKTLGRQGSCTWTGRTWQSLQCDPSCQLCQ